MSTYDISKYEWSISIFEHFMTKFHELPEQSSYINTLKQKLSGTKAYKETSEEEKSVVNDHCNHLALKFSVCVKEHQDRLPTMYWLPKLHKTPYKARFIANSSSCITTKLSKL